MASRRRWGTRPHSGRRRKNGDRPPTTDDSPIAVTARPEGPRQSRGCKTAGLGSGQAGPGLLRWVPFAWSPRNDRLGEAFESAGGGSRATGWKPGGSARGMRRVRKCTGHGSRRRGGPPWPPAADAAPGPMPGGGGRMATDDGRPTRELGPPTMDHRRPTADHPPITVTARPGGPRQSRGCKTAGLGAGQARPGLLRWVPFAGSPRNDRRLVSAGG